MTLNYPLVSDSLKLKQPSLKVEHDVCMEAVNLYFSFIRLEVSCLKSCEVYQAWISSPRLVILFEHLFLDLNADEEAMLCKCLENSIDPQLGFTLVLFRLS